MKLKEIVQLSNFYYKLASYKLKMLEEAPTLISTDVCAKCGGKCCKTMPGATKPSQWGSDNYEIKNNIEQALNSGNYSVDFYEDSDPVYHKIYYIRPSVVGSKSMISNVPSGTCSFLTPKGCSLDHEHRPVECQNLEAVDPGGSSCQPSSEDFKLENIVRSWEPYQNIIKFILKKNGYYP